MGYPMGHPTAAELGRARWCANHGHQWPQPLAAAAPGDTDWCGYCELLRIIHPDGRPEYVRPWDGRP
jgi:hypothetical protein